MSYRYVTRYFLDKELGHIQMFNILLASSVSSRRTPLPSCVLLVSASRTLRWSWARCLLLLRLVRKASTSVCVLGRLSSFRELRTPLPVHIVQQAKQMAVAKACRLLSACPTQ